MKPVQYGLIKKGQNAPRRRVIPNVFAIDGGENPAVDEISDVQRVNKEISERREIMRDADEKIRASVMNEDSSVYDYDSYYESDKRKAEAFHPLSSGSVEAPKSRYIATLQKAAERRERDKEKVYERKLLKERETEKGDSPDEVQFVTSAYKEKLRERQLRDYEEKLQDELDKRHDFRSQGMQGFYSNLLTKNISVGSSVEDNSLSIFTSGNEYHDKIFQKTHQVDGLDSSFQVSTASSKNDSSTNCSSSIVSTGEITSEPSCEIVQTLEETSSIQKRSFDELESTKEVINATSISTDLEVVELPVVSRDEKVLSAKERYLARKLQKTS